MINSKYVQICSITCLESGLWHLLKDKSVITSRLYSEYHNYYEIAKNRMVSVVISSIKFVKISSFTVISGDVRGENVWNSLFTEITKYL